ncbi:hypothetical protein [Pyrobaculum neutrophilum]|uniref:Uncharacterized protein n=1 Tax=Pyrobaculum neutrophilum (strain DSM 2338 / JCM 9278 / NBRC 100436 / V24Sta) TaxID=444157 RepID=B1Y8L0_PYRNV|nr:hypothetical protein [Pyrobaculum neutrophilum]ACB40089.1 hypothetical protein Tneu_1160 [Pyrobaculum neutrophilum V24Sta]
MRVLVALLFLGATAYAAQYVGNASVYMACGAWVVDFGHCYGDCMGYIFIPGYGARDVVRVYVGGREVPVNLTSIPVDDFYRPYFIVGSFRARAVGPVRVESGYGVEAYILVNFGVGPSGFHQLYVTPFIAGRGYTREVVLNFTRPGRFWVCTVGKYAGEAYALANGTWVRASVERGYYKGFVQGLGEAVRLLWAYVPESAVKVAYVYVYTPPPPVPPKRTYFVGLDGAPVPAWVLSRLVVGADKVGDGYVEFYRSAYLNQSGAPVPLEANKTYVVNGRHCRLVARTDRGDALPMEVYLGGERVASGVGEVRTYCLPETRVRYSYVRRTNATYVAYSGVSQGNVTLPLLPVALVYQSVLGLPVAREVTYAPPGSEVSIDTRRLGYSYVSRVRVEAPLEIAVAPLPPVGALGAAVAAALAVMAALRRHALVGSAVASVVVISAALAAVGSALGGMMPGELAAAIVGNTPLSGDMLQLWALLLGPPIISWLWSALDAARRMVRPHMVFHAGASTASSAILYLSHASLKPAAAVVAFSTAAAALLVSLAVYTRLERSVGGCRGPCTPRVDPAELAREVARYVHEARPEARLQALRDIAAKYLQLALRSCGLEPRGDFEQQLACAVSAGALTREEAERLRRVYQGRGAPGELCHELSKVVPLGEGVCVEIP